jgi:hypothetical protein
MIGTKPHEIAEKGKVTQDTFNLAQARLSDEDGPIPGMHAPTEIAFHQ